MIKSRSAVLGQPAAFVPGMLFVKKAAVSRKGYG